jgi:O-antigen ligase
VTRRGSGAVLGIGELSVDVAHRRERHAWWLGYLLCLALTGVVAAIAVATAPKPMSLAVLVLVLGGVVVVARPVFGVYLTVFLAILGDGITSAWYPFTKGFSSPESILFVSRSLIGSPLELYLVLLFMGWLLTRVAERRWDVVRGRFFWPLVAFAALLLIGFGRGIASGGNKNVALWEIRPILYLPLLYFLCTNLLRTKDRYERVYWAIIGATAINSVIALFFRSSRTQAQLSNMESLVQHGATLPMNALFVYVAGTWIFRSASRGKKVLLHGLAVPIVIAYLYSQRRAAIIALIAAVLLLFVVLFRTNRKLFFRLAPTVLVLGTLYTAAYWNSSGSLAFPAQAVKSVVAPDQLSARDQSSDFYRVVETIDIQYTIRTSPLMGIGFGQKFYRPFPLPQISSFLLADYITHNSILWIWMKSGVFGFLAMLYLFAIAMRAGARSMLATKDRDEAAMTLTSVGFVLMYAVFSYVDISWDAKSMVFLAAALAQIASVDRSRPTTTEVNVALEAGPPTEPKAANAALVAS